MVHIRSRYPLSESTWDESAWLLALGRDRRPETRTELQSALQFLKTSLAACQKPVFDPSSLTQPLMQGLQMAAILSDLRLDDSSILAALLYPAYRDYPALRPELQGQFPKAQALLKGLGDLSVIQARHSEAADLNHLRFLLMAVVEDLRVIVLKLAEHTILMRALSPADPLSKHRHMAKETLAMYAPLANRLGIGQIKWELEDLAFRALEPEVYKTIAHLLHEKRQDREDYINQAVQQIEAALLEEGIPAKVAGRAKHIFSIWKKMRQKGLGYEEIHDIRAIRVIVEDLKQCYAVLGIVHGLWQHIPKDFDDYIANPKENGYQSLHTGVVGPQGKILEVQIRTQAMHAQAELGVAAHWVYKEGEHQHPTVINKLSALRQILHWQEAMAPDTEAAEAIRAELFEDRVYVFTPKGEVLKLPRGATPLDFAYQVHTEVGHRCRGAKADGRMVPLTQPLNNGEQIEILTAKVGGPSRDWLNLHLGYLKTAQARAKVQQWFKKQDRDKNILEGKLLLEKELKRMALPVAADTLAQQFKMPKTEDLYLALGTGDLKIGQVVQALQILDPLKAKLDSLASVKAMNVRGRTPSRPGAIAVAGIGNLLCQVAKCCKPIPGDDIIGYIVNGRGVSVHRQDCHNILSSAEKNRHRLIEVTWGREKQSHYTVDLAIEAYDRHGLVRDVAGILASHQVNILSLKSQVDPELHRVHLRLHLAVLNLASLERVMTQIHHLPNVFDCRRVTH